jgi:gliding motility-associated protein GldM
MADRGKADPEGIDIKKQDDTNAASVYAITQKHGEELQKKIEIYRKFVITTFDNDPAKKADYERIFSTEPIKSKTASERPRPWYEGLFESMPLSAAAVMLTKFQSDIRATENELVQYIRGKIDADDFRVNKIEARVIPESKNVVRGGLYKAQIILVASDTTAKQTITVNGNVLNDKYGNYTATASGTTQKLAGTILVEDPITGKTTPYHFEDDYSVVEPSATIANQDMNVVYMGYDNRISISVPGFAPDKVTATATNASLEKTGSGAYICKPKSYENVIISVSVNVEGKSMNMGSQPFRVKTLPNPTIFLRFKNTQGNQVLYNPEIKEGAEKLTRQSILNADVVAEYADGLLQASFKVQSFTLSVSDGRGGFTASYSEGNNFSTSQKVALQKLKIGSKILLEKIKVTGAKSATLSYPPIDLP